MNDQAIFIPMLAMMVLTALVWCYMYARRIPAMRKAGVSVQTYATPGKIDELLPEDVNYSAQNFKNLFELPVLFYALCLYLQISGSVDGLYIATAWCFVALRAMHSVVQCSTNTVMTRFYVYAASSVVLWVILSRALLSALSVYV